MNSGVRSAAFAALLLLIATPLVAQSTDTRLIEAARSGDSAAVRSLLASGVDVNAADGDGLTALHAAAERGHDEVVEHLLARRADAGATTRIGSYTPLHLAALGAHAEVAEMLVEAGADPNAVTTNSGVTALHLAAAAIDGAPTVEVLLQHGADPNAREASAGQTPLMFAAAENQADAIRELTGAGADPSLTTRVVDVLYN